MGVVDVNTRDLRAAASRLQAIQQPLTAKAWDVTKRLEPQWKQLLASNASTRLERRVFSTGRAVATDAGVRLEAGATGVLSGGLSVSAARGPVEHGSNRGKRKTYTRRSRGGGTHSVTRRTAAQFRGVNKAGYVVGPAVKAFIPKLGKAWMDGLEDVLSDAVGGS